MGGYGLSYFLGTFLFSVREDLQLPFFLQEVSFSIELWERLYCPPSRLRCVHNQYELNSTCLLHGFDPDQNILLPEILSLLLHVKCCPPSAISTSNSMRKTNKASLTWDDLVGQWFQHAGQYNTFCMYQCTCCNDSDNMTLWLCGQCIATSNLGWEHQSIVKKWCSCYNQRNVHPLL